MFSLLCHPLASKRHQVSPLRITRPLRRPTKAAPRTARMAATIKICGSHTGHEICACLYIEAIPACRNWWFFLLSLFKRGQTCYHQERQSADTCLRPRQMLERDLLALHHGRPRAACEFVSGCGSKLKPWSSHETRKLRERERVRFKFANFRSDPGELAGLG